MDITLIRDFLVEDSDRDLPRMRVRARQAAPMSWGEERFRALYDNSPNAIGVVDRDGIVVQMNRASEAVIGLAPSLLVGKPFLERVHPDDLGHLAQSLQVVAAQPDASTTLRYRYRHANQRWRWLESTMTNLKAAPEVEGLLTTIRDITEQVEAEEQLRRQAERLQLLAELSADFSKAALDLDSILESLGRRVSEMLNDICVLRLLSDDGRTLEPIAVWHPDEEVRFALQGVLARPYRIDEWLPGAVIRHREALLIPQFDSAAERRRYPDEGPDFLALDVHSMLVVPLRVRGVAIGTLAASRLVPDQPYTTEDRDFLQDIADRAAQAVDNARLYRHAIDAEAQHRQLVEHLPAVVFVERVVGAQGNGIESTLYISPQVESVFGITAEQWMAMSDPWLTIIHPDDRTRLRSEFDRANVSSELFSVQFRAIRPDGELVHAECQARPIRDDEGHPRFWQGFIVDVTQRLEYEAALVDAEDKFRTLVEHIPAAIFTIGLDGEYLYMSPQIERLMGYPIESWLRGWEFWSTILHPDDFERVVAEDRRTDASDDPFDMEYRYIAANGEVVWVRNQTELLFDANGAPRFWQGYMIDITERKRAEQLQHEAEDQYRTLVEHSPAVIYTTAVDEQSTPLYMSPQIEAMLGYPPEAWGSPDIWNRIIHPDDSHWMSALEQQAGATLEPFDAVFRVYASDGRLVWVRTFSVPVCDDDGRPRYWQGYLIDMTAEKEAEDAIRLQAQLLDAVGQAVVASDTSRRITYWNRAAESLYGWTEAEALGKHLLDLTTPTASHAVAIDIYQQLDIGLKWDGEIEQRRREGSCFPAYLSNSPVIDANGRVIGTIGVVTDISERKRLEQQLIHQAFHDALTGLPNRSLFLDRTRDSLSIAQRVDRAVAVLFLDLDNFKIVNDSLGHDTGDILLVTTANRIRECLRHGDTAARLGGDEFAILLEDLSTADDALEVANRLLEALCCPVMLDGHEMFVTPSIGIAFSATSGDSAEDLLRDADVAMYTAKRNGRARIEVFEPTMGSIARQRLEVEHDLRRALDHGEFCLHYQPVVHLSDESLAGFEALLRWKHPVRGWVMPDDFVPIAEETGLIVPIGVFALREACRQMREWQVQWTIAERLSVSVNLSGRQFKEPGLANEVANVLRETGLQPRCLNLEITETIMMADQEGTSAVLREFEQLGVTLAIDDFGTGYSSLGTLRHFPVSSLKIDRSFVAGLGAESDDSIIVSGVVGLAHGLGLRVVAEGVETADHLARLQKLGCDLGQGYYFARPLTAEDARRYLAELAGRDSDAGIPVADWDIVAAIPRSPVPVPAVAPQPQFMGNDD